MNNILYVTYVTIIIFAGIGIGSVICELADSYNVLKRKFNEWRNKKCKIKCFCKHCYSIKYLWFSDNEACLECCKCNKTKRIRFDDESFEILEEARQNEINRRRCLDKKM